MLGDTTVKRRQRSTGKSGTTWTHTEERRPLMLPQELKELPNDEEIIFLEGRRPIRCRKNWYFRDRRLRKRIMAPVSVRPLTVSNTAPVGSDIILQGNAASPREPSEVGGYTAISRATCG